MPTNPYSLLGQDTSNPAYWGALEGDSADPLQLGVGDLIWQAAQKLGYTGTRNANGGDVQQIAAAAGLSPEQVAYYLEGVGGNPNGNPALFQGMRMSEVARDKQLADWLGSQGMSLNAVNNGREVIQQLRDAQGNPIAVDAHNYINDNKGVNRLGLAGAALIGGAAAMGGLGGAGAAPTLGSGASAAGTSLASIPADLMAGVGSSLGGSLSTVPGLGSVGSGLAAISPELMAGVGSSLGGSLSAVPGLGAAGAGGAGLGGSALADAALNASLESGSFLGASGGATTAGGGGLAGLGSLGEIALTNPELLMGATPALGGGFGGVEAGSWLDILKDGIGAVKDGVGSVADAVGGGKNLAGIVGAVAGAADAGKSDTVTSQSKMDPRMDAYVYGTGTGDPNSLLGAAQQWLKQNQSGMNADMTAGADMLRNLYTSPQYTQGYEQMRGLGQGLLNTQPAANPFALGLLSLSSYSPTERGQMPAGLLPVTKRRGSI